MTTDQLLTEAQCDEFTVASAGTEVRIVFAKEGEEEVDTATLRHLTFHDKAYAKKLEVRSDKTCSITEVNGKVLKSPSTIVGNGYHVTTGLKIFEFKILTSQATTDLKIFATS